MISFDRRASDRRGVTSPTSINLGGVLAQERRERRDRREQPRRRIDFDSIAHVARRIDAAHTFSEVMVDGSDGMRLVAMFACGCRATEPIGSGTSTVYAQTCAEHAPPTMVVERRRHQR